MKMCDSNDIKRMQKLRPDLNSQQAREVVEFMEELYAEQPYNMDTDAAFKSGADLMFNEAQV